MCGILQDNLELPGCRRTGHWISARHTTAARRAAWGFWRVRRRETSNALIGSRDNSLVALSTRTAIALGVFLAYLILGLA